MRTPLKLAVCALVLFTACKKYQTESQTAITTTTPLEASEDFTWSTTQNLQTNLTFGGALANQFVTFEILDKNFNRVYKLFKQENQTNIRIDQSVSGEMDSLYIYAPAIGFFKKFATSTASLTIVDGGGNSLQGQSPVKKGQSDLLASSKSGCSSCDESLPSGNFNKNVNTNQKICVTGNSSGGFTFNNGGEISVCGTLTVNYLNINNGLVNIVVHPGGTLIVNNMNMNGRGTIVNNGTISFQNTYSITTYFENNGVVTASGTINVNSGASSAGNREFINNNEITINGDANFDYEGYNNGHMLVKGHFKNNTNTFVNNCSLETEREFHVNRVFTNNGFVKAGQYSFINGGSTFFMKNLSLLKTEGIHLNATVHTDGVGVIAVNSYTNINASFGVNGGFIDICDADGNFENNDANAATLAKLKFCETSVAADGNCFGEGHTVAGSGGGSAGSYTYPSTGAAYRAYEDLWPARGDYDFNDMVIKYTYEATTNAQNNLTQVDFEITLPALGASYKNGIALQLLHKSGNTYSRATGGVFESAQTGVTVDPSDQDVIIIDQDVFATIPTHYRNVGDGAEAAPYTFTATVLVKESAEISATDLVLDLFLFRSTNRGLEVHLPGMPPSAAATASLFNTIDDDSNNAGWYRGSNNLPWGIEIVSSATWKHPLTKVPVWQAYPEFNNWVNSGGAANQDWYNNPVGSLVYQFVL